MTIPKPIKIVLSLTAVLLVVYCLWTIVRAYKQYRHLQIHSRHFSKKLHEYDSLLGYAPIPDSKGFQLLPGGKQVAIYHNHFGFRDNISQGTKTSTNRPSMLFLGCSYTYGYGCQIDSTFPMLINQTINGTVYNAGVSGYGLSQILVRAEKYIPQLKPDYVILQISPWHSERSRMISHSVNGYIPIPYFAKSDSSLSIRNPVFKSKIPDLNPTYYKNLNFWKYFSKVAFPALFYNDFMLTLTWLKVLLKIIPPAVTNAAEIEDFTYHKIEELCLSNNCKVIVWVISDKPENEDYKTIKKKFKTMRFVNVDSLLWAPLKDKTMETYYHQYGTWANDSLIDTHPNKKAHRIIAKGILSAMQDILNK